MAETGRSRPPEAGPLRVVMPEADPPLAEKTVVSREESRLVDHIVLHCDERSLLHICSEEQA
jgi:hypothetical protein